MTLTTGARLGPYEIQAAIGAGGMGEVYRARDTRLDRTVAIKILPEALASDPQFRERFDREARAISSLNHPHICTLHDVGRQDPSTSSGHAVDFLVMEYLEGETLADRLSHVGRVPRSGPANAGSNAPALKVEEALAIATQIADALAAAHRAGVIHRDLKPGNIFLVGKRGSSGDMRRGGSSSPPLAKLLDFGLAKATAPAVAGTSLSMAETTPPSLTGQGTILGTFQYMAPEQIEGRDADARTDIFAFGAVLYEMLTGRKAFEGKSHASLIGAIMHAEPAPLSSVQPLTPRSVERIVRKCLAKDPDDRWQTARDLLDDLKWTIEADAPQGAAVSVVPLARPRPGRFTSARLAWTLLATAGLAIVALAIPAVLHLRERPVENPEVRLELTTPATRQPLHFAISPDGRRLVFVASGDGGQRLWQRPLDAVTALPLEGTEGAEFPFWSSDSRAIGFFASGKLKRIDITGGPPQIVADAPNGRGGAWNRDGTILFAPSNASGLLRVPASGGEPQPVTKLDPPRQGSHRLPQFLPDGRHFLFFAQGNPEGQGIYLGSLDGTDTIRLTSAEAAGAFVEPGALVFMQQNTLVVRSLDVLGGVLTGDPVTVADRVSYDAGFNLAGFSVSAMGRLAYRAGGSERRQLTWFDRTGIRVGVAGEPDANDIVTPSLSPDGRRIAVTRTVQGNVDMWVIDVERGGATRFTFDPSVESNGVWSPDGTGLAFQSTRQGNYDLFLKPSSGAGADELVLASPFTKMPTDWSLDGRFLLYQHGDPKTGWDLAALPMTGDRKPIVVVSTPFEERGGQFSPDGRWVAYQSNESGGFEIYVQPFPGPGGKWKVSTAGGTDARWRPDGKELFFLAPDAKLMAVSVRASDSTFEVGSPAALFQTRTVAGGNAGLRPQYAVSRDGRFLINVPDETSTAAPITVVLNWTPGLKP